MQSLLFVWCFALMLREMDTFSTWGIPPIAVGVFLVVTSLAVYGHVCYMTYMDMDPHVIAQIREDATARSTRGRAFKKGDVIIRAASGNHKVLNQQDFSEQFELEPEQRTSIVTDGFQSYRASGKLWVHEISEEEAATHFPANKFISAGTLVTVQPGDVLLMPFPGGGELHRLDKTTFDNKYTSAFSKSSRHQRRSLEGYIPTQADTLAHWEKKIKNNGTLYRKTAKMHAKLAEESGIIETIVDGECEARKPYDKGDFILIGSRGGR